MEKENELSGDGNSYTTEFRQYDPRLGRWFSVDPSVKPWESPYVAFNNNPILFNDPRGDDPPAPLGDHSKSTEKFNRKFERYQRKHADQLQGLSLENRYESFRNSKNLFGQSRGNTAWFSKYENNETTRTATTNGDVHQGVNRTPRPFTNALPPVTGDDLNAPLNAGAPGYNANQTYTQNLGPLGDRRRGTLGIVVDAFTQADHISVFAANPDGTRGRILWENAPVQATGATFGAVPLALIPARSTSVIVVITSTIVRNSNYQINIGVTGIRSNYPLRIPIGSTAK